MLRTLAFYVVLAPLFGAILSGVFGKQLGRTWSHRASISGMIIAFVMSVCIAWKVLYLGQPGININLYSWALGDMYRFNVSFFIDPLSAMMLVTVNFVSLLVHIYSIGYMEEDPGYQRFFSYMSLFTFFMIMLVLANNFMQLFFGWEGVGLVSYLLIGFWYKKDSANCGSMKAFIVNRVGDLGFILGIGAILTFFHTVDFQAVFALVPKVMNQTIDIIPGSHWNIITVACILLFIGAMGKSAQMPLHIWLPESMEGPTPISALIHAATMVTAGVYMVARMSPLFEHSSTALSVVLIIGSTSALFTGMIAVVQNDIKRVIAYSTLSQLGYMVAACGASAYSAGVFHLFTHACFKAMLFLSAGSVIISMHHEQDMQKMGGLYKYLPITYICYLIGGLALTAIPPFSGFYSKDAIIEAVEMSKTAGSHYAYYCLLIGAFITALYTFRSFFLTFHTKERFSEKTRKSLKESSWVVTYPLILLAIPSVFLGAFLAAPLLYDHPSLFGSSIVTLPSQNMIAVMAKHYHGAIAAMAHAPMTLPFWFAIAGIFVAWLTNQKCPQMADKFSRFPLVYKILINKYGFDELTESFFIKGTKKLSSFLYHKADENVIDNMMVNGSGRVFNALSIHLRRIQTGLLYQYTMWMLIGLIGFLIWFILIK